MVNDHLSEAQLRAALTDHWNVQVHSYVRLDLNVSRIDLDDDTSWVVRVYPGQRTVVDNDNLYVAVNSLVKLLEHLAGQEYPVEQLASANPVAQIAASDPRNAIHGTCILVTRFVPGRSPERNRVTFYRLGRLLGKLHAMPIPPGTPEGGAWHHLCIQGGFREEYDAALMLLAKLEHHNDEPEIQALDVLKEKLHHLKQVFVDVEPPLPRALVHPDLVPTNVIAGASVQQDDKGNEFEPWTVIDWTGAGVGTRVLSLGFLLAVAAARGKLILVDAVMKAYSEHVQLEPGELDRLSDAVSARFLTIQCWEAGLGRKTAVEVVNALPRLIQDAENVSKRVRELVQVGN